MSVETPIVDFLKEYAGDAETIRLHMPGHKGRGYLGLEPYDLTEVEGADALYCPEGIIARSEQIATRIFGSARTVYSAGGSSQSIFAALWLLRRYASDRGLAPLVLAARNVHQSFVSGVAQTGLEVAWFCPRGATDLACPMDAVALEAHLRGMPIRPIAVYITSPDYLGNLQPVAQIAEVCHRLGVLLVVDNAHGAYLKALPQPGHPLDIGADIVCDSAHKTLCALTGAAYLHFGRGCPAYFADRVKDAMLSVGSTSPSYLIMASLDRTNAALDSEAYVENLLHTASAIAAAKARLEADGWRCLGDEPLKLTLYLPSKGLSATQVAHALHGQNVVPEHCDDRYLILMASADTPPAHVERAAACLLGLGVATSNSALPSLPALPPKAMEIRDAYLAPQELCPIAQCIGRVLAYLPVKCPPAVPAVIAGERLTEDVIRYLQTQGYTQLAVVK